MAKKISRLAIALLLATFFLNVNAASLIATWNAENGTVGQKPPAPLTAVSGPNIPLIDDSPVFSGTKAYDVYLNKNRPTILGQVQNPYRTEMRGGINFEFERTYWIGVAFRRTVWDYDTSGESWPIQVHEAPSSWINWGTSPCTQSANATAPVFFINSRGNMSFRNLNNTLWTKPIDIGVWHTMVIRMKLSKGTSGFIESWYDGVQQARYPTSGTRQTHRADSALNAFCGPNSSATGDVTFVPPLFATGVYKWDWNPAKLQPSLTTIRQGSLDAIKMAIEDVSGDAGNGFALVDPLGGGSTDTTPPTISSMSETLITSSGATINWTTNEAANERIDYGTTTGYGSVSTSATLGTSHSRALTGLAANTLINYKITSCDGVGNCASSANRTFTTLTAAEAFSNISISSVTSSTALVTWTTAVPRTSVISYGATTSYGSEATEGTLKTSHSLTLTGLTASQVYNLKLGGLDGSSQNAESANQTFRTLHSITGLSATEVITTGFVCSATTSELTTSTCNYGLTSAYGSTRTRDGTRTAHEIRLDPTVGITLAPSTAYHWQFCGVNSLGVNSCSADQTVTTADPEPAISNIVISKTTTTITVTWDTNIAANSIIKHGKRIGQWTTQTNASLVTTGHSVTITGLTSNTSYAILLRSENSTGTAIESNVVLVRTKKPSGLTDTPFSWLSDLLEAA